TGIDGESLKIVKEPDFVNVSKLAVKFSDGVIIGSDNINEELKKHLSTINKPVLEYKDENEYIDAYNEFHIPGLHISLSDVRLLPVIL
ncbi:MAG TPA: hypothetical protein VHO68_00610, partial [Bacteroidales bacterium]|nr:hypothetical protein [Bacteroidales bacterium]